MRISILLLIVYLLLGFGIAYSQSFYEFQDQILDNGYAERQATALAYLRQIDTTQKSELWPNLIPSRFYKNMERNILFPDKFDQGRKTNFCGLAAASHILIRYQPDEYARILTELYNKGIATYTKGQIKVSRKVREAIGTLRFHGELDVNHADQVWLLSLAGRYKCYLNWVNMNYTYGDEGIIWASVSLGKFNRLLRILGQYNIDAVGSDLIRPKLDNPFQYLSDRLSKGLVILYINSHALQPSSYKHHFLVSATHFIQLYALERRQDGLVVMTFWDYGEKTEILIPEAKLGEVLYGVSFLTLKNDKRA